MVSERAFIFHKCIYCCKILSFVRRSSLSAKVNVKCQGHIFPKRDKKGVTGTSCFTNTFCSIILPEDCFLRISSKTCNSVVEGKLTI